MPRRTYDARNGRRRPREQSGEWMRELAEFYASRNQQARPPRPVVRPTERYRP